MKPLSNKTLETSKIIFLSLLLGLGINYIFAAPPTPPICPNNVDGCNAPLNVGYTSQIKQGNLDIKGLTSAGVSAVNGLIVENGNVGIGTTSPATPLDVRSANGGYVQLNPSLGDIEIGSGTNSYSNIDFKGSNSLTSDYGGRMGFYDSSSGESAIGHDPAGTGHFDFWINNHNTGVGSPVLTLGQGGSGVWGSFSATGDICNITNGKCLSQMPIRLHTTPAKASGVCSGSNVTSFGVNSNACAKRVCNAYSGADIDGSFVDANSTDWYADCFYVQQVNY